ncbi:hypothetical protein vseg_021183 [Gypsophila vaccaria]
MTSRQQKKFRYVKCPKCARILPEPEQIPLYRCGGCGTILKAKYYKKQKDSLVPTSRTVDAVQSNDNGHACEVEQSEESSPKSSDNQSSIQNGDIGEKAVDDCNSDQIGDDISAHHTSLSKESSVLKAEGGRQVTVAQGESGEALDTNADEFASVGHVNNQKQGQAGTTNSPDEFSSNKDHSIVQDKEAEQLPREIETIEDGSDQDQDNGPVVEKKDDEQTEKMNQTCETYTVDVAIQAENDWRERFENIGIEKQEEVRHENSKNQASVMIGSQSIEKPMHMEPLNVAEGSKVSVNEISCLTEDEVVGVSKLGKDDKVGKGPKSFIERIREKLANVTISNDFPKSTEVDDGNENSLPVAEARLEASAPSIIASGRTASDVIPQDADCELTPLNDFKETAAENIENFEDSALNERGQSEPTSNTENLDPLDTHEKGSNFVKETSQYPIKEPLAYDGSVSSCDGNDDQAPGELEHLNGGTVTGNDGISDYAATEKKLRSQLRGKSYASQLSDETEKHSVLEEQGSVRENEARGYDRTRQQRDHAFPPRVPFNRKSSEIPFETGSSSSYVNDEPPSNWTRNHPYRYEEQEQGRRNIYGRRDFMEGRQFSEGPWRENDVLPMYQNNETFSGDFYQKDRYHGYSDSDVRRRAGSRFLSCNLPRTDYSGEVYSRRYPIHSGEVYNGRDLMRDHYMDYFPYTQRRSTHLPPGPPRYREGSVTYIDPARETRWDPYDPYLTNRHRLMDYESYGWTHDRAYLSDDQWQKDWVARRPYMKEKRQVVKRHFRPMAGGAPFITCHFCFKILQLPEEFLLFKRRKIHQLECGACSKILKFSLENESCLAPRLPYSDEGENTNLDLPRDTSVRAQGREKSNLESSHSRSEARVYESSDGGNDAASPSVESRQVKVTWHLPARTKSPLHKLLGYPSPRDLLAAHTVDDQE